MLPESKKKKINPLLMKVIVISVAIHVIAAAILGGITIVKYVIPDDAQFEEPPAVVEEAPPPEVKVQIRPPAPQQQPMNNLRMRPVANIAVANVDVNLPSMDQSFTVSAGLGGIGGGNLLGGASGNLRIGLSDVSVFGLKSRAEKILFIVEANRRMVYDSKGGLHSYRVIKDEITDMIGNLSAGALFNVMLVDERSIKLFKPQLVPAGAEITAELSTWFAPVNSSIKNLGIGRGAKAPVIQTKLDKHGQIHAGLSRYREGHAITQVGLEMGVDAIFMIVGGHGGFGRIRMDLTPEERAKYNAKVAALKEQYQTDPKLKAMVAARKAEEAELRKQIKIKHDALNKQRAKKGQPPKVLPRSFRQQMKALGLKYKTPEPPKIRPPSDIADAKQVRRYFHDLCNTLFSQNDKPRPSVNVVLFLAEDEAFSDSQKDAVKDFVSYFKGKMRVIRGLQQIKAAATAKDTTN
jgi:hypothetical protein